MRINFDVTFPSLPCAVLSLDSMDASGTASIDILHNIFKQQLDVNGVPIGSSVQTRELQTLKKTEDLLKEKQKAIAEGRLANTPANGVVVDKDSCLSCFGAGAPGECCNTCEEVREAYKRKGWQFNMKGVEQCSKEGFYGDINSQVSNKEGCNMYGYLEVPKVPGNFHFAPGHGLQHTYNHVHDLVSFTFQTFNITHRVNALSFGVYYPGAKNSLDNRIITVTENSGMHQYFIKLVPTTYQYIDGREISSYQFSVTEHLRPLDPRNAAFDSATGLLPGVFFNYELSPIKVRIQEQSRSFGHFLTNLFAIIGGVFVVMGLVDSLLHRTIEGLSKGSRTGGSNSGSNGLLM